MQQSDEDRYFRCKTAKCGHNHRLLNIPSQGGSYRDNICQIVQRNYLQKRDAIEQQALKNISQLYQNHRKELNRIDQMFRLNPDYQILNFQFLNYLQRENANEPNQFNPLRPGLWLQIFSNCELMTQHIKPGDENLLKHLVKVSAKKQKDHLSIDFHFQENEWIQNKTLRKTIQFNEKKEKKDQKAIASYGDKIEWKEGVMLPWKEEGSRNQRMQTSFFSFFREIKKKSEYLKQQLQIQFQVALNITDFVFPNIIQYYIGNNSDLDSQPKQQDSQPYEQMEEQFMEK